MAHTDLITGNLVPDYTILYKDYVEMFGALDLSMFPTTVAFNDRVFDMSDLFTARNNYKEIGCETAELFKDVAQRVINEAALIFLPKIEQWNAKVKDLFKREDTEQEETVNEYYLNPTVPTDRGPKIQSSNKSIYQHHIVFGQGVSEATMLTEIMELENIYYEALKYLDRLFIGLY